MTYQQIIGDAVGLILLTGPYFFGEFCNALRIDYHMKEGKRWDEIKYKTPLSKFLVNKKSL